MTAGESAAPSEADGVYTDGSASPNPGRGGWAAVLVSGGQVTATASGGESATTNNRMELKAAIAGVHMIERLKPQSGGDGGQGPRQVTLYTDSTYVVQAMETWIHSWRRNGWVSRTGPVKNQDLIEELRSALDRNPHVRLAWVKGHNGNRWNEHADLLARAGQPAS